MHSSAMWLNPLPAETMIGAIFGAILATIMEQYGYFHLTSLFDIRFPLEFAGAILIFGLTAHFYCAAVLLPPTRARGICLGVCIGILVLMAVYSPRQWTITAQGGFFTTA